MTKKEKAKPKKKTCATCGAILDGIETDCMIQDAMIEANYIMTDGEVKFKPKDYWCSCWCAKLGGEKK